MTDDFAAPDLAVGGLHAGQDLFRRVSVASLSFFFLATGAACIVQNPEMRSSAEQAPERAVPSAEVIAFPNGIALRALARTLTPLEDSLPIQMARLPDPEPAAPENHGSNVEPGNMPPLTRDVEMPFSVPLPIKRPPELSVQNEAAPPTNAVSEEKGVLERLLGWPKKPEPVLAYATPEDRPLSGSPITPKEVLPAYDKMTAVYVISTRTVYMPNGAKLEAHSGIGDLLDDPEHVHVRMRGATPPAVYELTPREKPFHGVQALRLSPISKSNPLGRTGLLAHPFMLGPNGDLNGCVSIRDYKAFLEAYESGQIKRLAVIARLD